MSLIYAVTASLALLLAASVQSYTITLYDKETQCFNAFAPAGSTCTGKYEVLSDEESAVLDSIEHMVWEYGCLEQMPLPCDPETLTFGDHFNRSLDNTTLPDGDRFGVVAAPHGKRVHQLNNYVVITAPHGPRTHQLTIK